MKPLILNYAIDREEDIESFYDYDYSQSLNVITIDEKKRVLIDSTRKELSQAITTRVKSESDESGIDNLELLTKTKIDRESDDDDFNILLELKTKTFTQRERDDEGSYSIQ